MIKTIYRYLHLIFLCCFLILGSACSREGIDTKHFLFEAELVIDCKFPMEVFNPKGLHIYKDYLILHQIYNNRSFGSYFFQVYNLSDGTYMGSCAGRGRGPNEWLQLDVARSSVNAPYFYFLDVPIRQTTAVIHKATFDSIAQMTVAGSFSIEKRGYSSMNNLVVRNDSLLVYDEVMPERAVHLYHLRGERPVITWTYGKPFDHESQINEDLGRLVANDSRIIFLYRYKNRIDILDWNLRLKKRLNYARNDVIVRDENEANSVRYYGSAFLGEHFLYARYYGGLKYSIDNVSKEVTDDAVIEVFDLNGTPVCRYTFAGPTPTNFTVDERTFTLYAHSNEDGLEDYISVFRLPGLKEYLKQK